MYILPPNLISPILIDLGSKLCLWDQHKLTTLDDPSIVALKNSQQLTYLVAINNFSISRDINFHLSSPNSQVNILGYVITSGSTQVHLKTTISHLTSNTQGSCYIKGVLQDTSHLSLHGMIHITNQAPQSQNQLTEKLLVLSPDAVGELKPELEISNHEVKASHATTISQIDTSQLFYLQSRGLNPNACQKMLINGFLNEIVLQFKNQPILPKIQKSLVPIIV